MSMTAVPRLKSYHFTRHALMNPIKKSHLAALTVAIAAVTVGTALLDDRATVHAEVTPALPVVNYASAQQRSISDRQDYTGRLEAVDVADVRPRVPGTLLTVHFKAGQHVRQGDLLFTIDPAPYETQVRQAQANLAGIEERKRLAMIEQDRSKRLLASNEFLAGDEYTIADMAVWPWYPSSLYGVYGTHEFLAVEQYTHLLRWHETLAARPAVARGRVVNRTSGAPGENLRERHDASDFDSLTQEKS
jgi:biotin carboxyl carrier protein